MVSNQTNKWFDPIIPSQLITRRDVCVSFAELFQELHKKNKLKATQVQVYAYVLVYEMYLNAMEQVTFQRCSDKDIIAHSKVYCRTHLVSHLNVTLWNNDNKLKACRDSLTYMKEKCHKHKKHCYPCAYSISFLFRKYERYIMLAL